MKLLAVVPLTWGVAPTLTDAPVVVKVATSAADICSEGNRDRDIGAGDHTDSRRGREAEGGNILCWICANSYFDRVGFGGGIRGGNGVGQRAGEVIGGGPADLRRGSNPDRRTSCCEGRHKRADIRSEGNRDRDIGAADHADSRLGYEPEVGNILRWICGDRDRDRVGFCGSIRCGNGVGQRAGEVIGGCPADLQAWLQP